MISGIVLILASCGFWMGAYFVAAKKMLNKIAEELKPREGIEIYEALFGQPIPNCVDVIDRQDQVIPIIDTDIKLHFYTCKEELKRILSQHQYTHKKVAATTLFKDTINTAAPWFNPGLLADSVQIFVYEKDEYGNQQRLYCNTDSTEVYCLDIAD